MKNHRLIATLLSAAALSTSLGVHAQPGPGPDHGPHGQQGGPGADSHGGPGGPGGPGPQRQAHDMPRPHQDWRRGGRVPSDYRQSHYVIDDWRGHHLRQPPRGYHWLDVNGDYVLAAVATGVIAQIITSGR